MVEKFVIAQRIINHYIFIGEPFTLKEVYNDIKKDGGILKVTPDISVKKHLESLCIPEFKCLKYNPQNKTYSNVFLSASKNNTSYC